MRLAQPSLLWQPHTPSSAGPRPPSKPSNRKSQSTSQGTSQKYDDHQPGRPCKTDPGLDTINLQHLIKNYTQSISSLAWRYRNNNLLNQIAKSSDSLRVLRLRIGPLFTLKQLDELLLSHLPTLQFINLRFNQNLFRRAYSFFSLSLQPADPEAQIPLGILAAVQEIFVSVDTCSQLKV
ncbi:hypothetical protein PGT21_031399 [Puccinia graminis f. sp. tritici]|uniref:Uncharacterized protein n=1 Tax=Puccinia graminis f. sp. tritici TaxID=56615 RepID=A0A5B0NDY0_PUCGR|nr:hypothetical protein PGT21_031399 [Puccinia graminis f. sp. tritici]